MILYFYFCSAPKKDHRYIFTSTYFLQHTIASIQRFWISSTPSPIKCQVVCAHVDRHLLERCFVHHFHKPQIVVLEELFPLLPALHLSFDRHQSSHVTLVDVIWPKGVWLTNYVGSWQYRNIESHSLQWPLPYCVTIVRSSDFQSKTHQLFAYTKDERIFDTVQPSGLEEQWSPQFEFVDDWNRIWNQVQSLEIDQSKESCTGLFLLRRIAQHLFKYHSTKFAAVGSILSHHHQRKRIQREQERWQQLFRFHVKQALPLALYFLPSGIST